MRFFKNISFLAKISCIYCNKTNLLKLKGFNGECVHCKQSFSSNRNYHCPQCDIKSCESCTIIDILKMLKLRWYFKKNCQYNNIRSQVQRLNIQISTEYRKYFILCGKLKDEIIFNNAQDQNNFMYQFADVWLQVCDFVLPCNLPCKSKKFIRHAVSSQDNLLFQGKRFRFGRIFASFAAKFSAIILQLFSFDFKQNNKFMDAENGKFMNTPFRIITIQPKREKKKKFTDQIYCVFCIYTFVSKKLLLNETLKMVQGDCIGCSKNKELKKHFFIFIILEILLKKNKKYQKKKNV